ncbi:MAG: hypothetical protein ACRELZ_20135 [Candidatus Rokuibacteriota bacterium]
MRILTTTMVGVALVGCGIGPHFWTRPGAALPDFERDHGGCFKDATIGYGVGSEKAYKACMASKGWTRTQTETGLPDDRHFRGVEGDEEFARPLTQQEQRDRLQREQPRRASDDLACRGPRASRPPGLVCR